MVPQSLQTFAYCRPQVRAQLCSDNKYVLADSLKRAWDKRVKNIVANLILILSLSMKYNFDDKLEYW